VLGSRVTGVALPLLVLDLTGSPARAGLAEFAYLLPIVAFTLPAGAVSDRWNRKRVMIAADAARGLAIGSLALALLAHRPAFAQILAVAFVEGSGFTFFTVAQQAALRQLVPAELLPAAAAQNQGREFGALLVGQPLGGFLFSVGRVVPWAFDAISYLVSLTTLALIRRPLEESRGPADRHLGREIQEGLRFLWRQPFLRASSILVTGSDFVLNALFLGVIVIARQHGATPTLIGTMVAFLGVGGLLGSLVAPALASTLTLRQTVALTMVAPALLLPLLLLVAACGSSATADHRIAVVATTTQVADFARNVGVAFQILNDIKDWTGDEDNKLERRCRHLPSPDHPGPPARASAERDHFALGRPAAPRSAGGRAAARGVGLDDDAADPDDGDGRRRRRGGLQPRGAGGAAGPPSSPGARAGILS
jgi:MFS family permease